jgi:hypothetical protein
VRKGSGWKVPGRHNPAKINVPRAYRTRRVPESGPNPDPAEVVQLAIMRKAEFKRGDAVVLARGPNWGTRGTFLEFRPDAKWADLAENGHVTRPHPVEWLEHADISVQK